MRNREVTLEMPGDPVAKARARLKCGFKKRFYDAQHHIKLASQIILQDQFKGYEPFEGPCMLSLAFFMPIKKSHWVPEGSYHYYRPDTDNLCKWIMDISNGILYKDDCCIAVIHANKVYSHNPRTVITIRELIEVRDIDDV